MRKLIAGMKISIDGKMEGSDGVADWVGSWSEDYGLMQQVDACVLGGTMYPGYERYWTSLQRAPETPAWITNAPPTPAELQWARFAAQTPHYVLSNTLSAAAWPQTRFLRSLEEIGGLKNRPGKDIYLMGGAQTTASCIDAGLVDELRLLVYPLIAGKGKALFAHAQNRHGLVLQKAEQLDEGLLRLVYVLK